MNFVEPNFPFLQVLDERDEAMYERDRHGQIVGLTVRIADIDYVIPLIRRDTT